MINIHVQNCKLAGPLPSFSPPKKIPITLSIDVFAAINRKLNLFSMFVLKNNRRQEIRAKECPR